MDKTTPQSACSADKRSRSVDPSTGMVAWSRCDHSRRQRSAGRRVPRKLSAGHRSHSAAKSREIIREPWAKPCHKVPAPQANGVAARLRPPRMVAMVALRPSPAASVAQGGGLSPETGYGSHRSQRRTKAGNDSRALDETTPQSACSAGKRSRSATPSTPDGGQWSRCDHSRRQRSAGRRALRKLDASHTFPAPHKSGK